MVPRRPERCGLVQSAQPLKNWLLGSQICGSSTIGLSRGKRCLFSGLPVGPDARGSREWHWWSARYSHRSNCRLRERNVPWNIQLSIARYRLMASPSFTGRPARKTRRRFSCYTDFHPHRGCSNLSLPGFRITITLSPPTTRDSDTATARTRKASRIRSITSPKS